MIKYVITDFRRVTLYGDCHLEEWGCFYPYRGKVLKVKLLGLFWITYKKFTTH